MNFPNYYQPNYQYPQYTQPKQEERIWVQNQQEAENYLIAPNNFVRLWDINQPRFYERKCDVSGKPSPIEVYEYKLVSGQVEEKPDYSEKFDVFSNRLEEFGSEIQSIKDRLSGIEKTAKKEK